MNKYINSSNPTPNISHWLRYDIGLAISIFPVAQIRKLHNKILEKENILLLKENAGNFESINTDKSESEWGKLIEKTPLKYFDLHKAPCDRL